MLMTIATTVPPATDLGYLVHKHPDRLQSFPLSIGTAYIFFPVARDDYCQMAMTLVVDPVALSRGESAYRGSMGALYPYVNDRPYVMSSFFSVAMARVLSSAMAGRSASHPELVDRAFPFEIALTTVRAPADGALIRRLFEPLGYAVEVTQQPLDPHLPQWGMSQCFAVRLTITSPLNVVLTHLYTLLPVLDGKKHYWVGEEEVCKLVQRGAGWLEAHPEKPLVAARYLNHRPRLERSALEQLMSDEASVDDEPARATREAAMERPLSLNEKRLGTVVSVLKQRGASRIADVGCGEGKLLETLVREAGFTQLVGMDVSLRSLEIASNRLERLGRSRHGANVELIQGSLTYRDARLAGMDAICLVEVIEHLDLDRLPALVRNVFGDAQPRAVIVTTPNREHNVRFEGLADGQLRHADHRFEWTRNEFAHWAESIAEQFNYRVRFLSVGPHDQEVGPPTPGQDHEKKLYHWWIML